MRWKSFQTEALRRQTEALCRMAKICQSGTSTAECQHPKIPCQAPHAPKVTGGNGGTVCASFA